jgi:hypothetical protein
MTSPHPRRLAATIGAAALAIALAGAASPALADDAHGHHGHHGSGHAGSGHAAPRPARPAALPACGSSDPADCGQLFDDFSYSSNTDPAIVSHGWYVRSGAGGPGQSGATWKAANVAFPTVDGAKSLQLTTTTNGTAAGTTQSEFGRTAEDAFAGTYVARIKFSDAPVSGPDGDHVVQTFFAISSPPDCDPTYSETDFSEYLPNGGYGETRTFNSQSTWALTGDGCDSDFVESDQYASLAGWHTVMATVSNGTVKYLIDGTVVGTATGKYFPRRNMSIAFNNWTLDLTGHTGSATSTWREAVDYVYYAENRVLTPAQATTQVTGFRNAGKTFVDTVGAA